MTMWAKAAIKLRQEIETKAALRALERMLGEGFVMYFFGGDVLNIIDPICLSLLLPRWSMVSLIELDCVCLDAVYLAFLL